MVCLIFTACSTLKTKNEGNTQDKKTLDSSVAEATLEDNIIRLLTWDGYTTPEEIIMVNELIKAQGYDYKVEVIKPYAEGSEQMYNLIRDKKCDIAFLTLFFIKMQNQKIASQLQSININSPRLTNYKDLLPSLKYIKSGLDSKGSPLYIPFSGGAYGFWAGGTEFKEGTLVWMDTINFVKSLSGKKLEAAEIFANFDLSFEFIGLITTDGILQEANQTALTFAGVSLSEVIGKPFWDTPWWSHSSQLQEFIKKAVQTATNGEMLRAEVALVSFDDKVRIIDFTMKPIKDDSGNIIMLLPEGHDITELKNAEEELKRFNNQLGQIVSKAILSLI